MHRHKRLNLVILALFLSIWGLGAWGFIVSQGDTWRESKAVFSAAYKSLQMFGLNFDLEPRKKEAGQATSEKTDPPDVSAPKPASSGDAGEKVVEWPLQIARFLAPAFTALSAILLISRPWRVALQICLQIFWSYIIYFKAAWRGQEPGKDRRQRPSRIIVFGYGPVGRAIARRFRTSDTITAIDLDPDGSKQTAADEDGVLFVEGDGSHPEVLQRLYLAKSRLVFVAYEEDNTSLDAAVAITAFTNPKYNQPREPAVRLILKSLSLGQHLADSQLAMVNKLHQVEQFMLPEMSAIRLCETARFDRVALEAKQPRTHVVIIGCGALGQAILSEVLLTAWRVKLQPPMVTVFDCSIDPVRSSIESAAPALFIVPGTPGGLPKHSAPKLAFYSTCAQGFDLDDLNALARLPQEPVTAFVIATGRDEVNLETALLLEKAMLQRQLKAAPIHVRLSNKYHVDAIDLGTAGIGLISPFGSLDEIVSFGRAFDDDPDKIPRKIHDLYCKQQKADDNTLGQATEWDKLEPTFKNANRRLYRHAAQKLEDFGFQVNSRHHRLMRVTGEQAEEIRNLKESLKDRYGSIPDIRDKDCPSQETPEALLGQMACLEHERWMTERALSGWRPANLEKHEKRDNIRKIHQFMLPWKDVDEDTRRNDLLLFWALTLQSDGNEPEIFKQKTCKIWLHELKNASKIDVIFRALQIEEDIDDKNNNITVYCVCFGVLKFNENHVDRLSIEAANYLLKFIENKCLEKRMIRINFKLDLCRRDNFLWVVEELFDRIHDQSIEITVSWSNEAIRLGLVGHRDTSRAGGDEVIEARLKARFLNYAIEGNDIELVSGYAPGVDKIAVDTWAHLGLPKPRIVMPYSETEKNGSVVYWTGEPGTAGAIGYPEEKLKNIGTVVVAAREPHETGHQAQLRYLLNNIDELIAVWDGKVSSAPGGTSDAVDRAKNRNIPIIFS